MQIWCDLFRFYGTHLSLTQENGIQKIKNTINYIFSTVYKFIMTKSLQIINFYDNKNVFFFLL
jgi:hypothetical protein